MYILKIIPRTRTARFIALPVGQGDAFYLESGGFSVLVDGGGSRKKLPQLFKKYTKKQHVTVLAITHNDSDHVNGVIGFLESDLLCEELWLPGSWAYRINDILENPYDFLDELMTDIEILFKILDGDSISFENLGNIVSNFIEMRDTITKKDLPMLLEIVRRGQRVENYFLDNSSKLLKSLKFVKESIYLLKVIAQIFELAKRRGIRIRFFEYTPKKIPPLKIDFYTYKIFPVNAVEKTTDKIAKNIRALPYLALTRSNKESLVFISPKASGHPGVLFTGDSDLSFKSEIPWEEVSLITVPHHGSGDNKNAYARFNAEKRNKEEVIWVRSDKNSKSRPDSIFYTVPGERFCTTCKKCHIYKQPLIFLDKRGKWVALNSKPCCKHR